MIYLVDGSHLLHRIRHTPQALLTTKDGKPSGLVFGFLRSLAKIRRESKNTAQLVVAWDKTSSEFRTKLFPDYKKGRYSNMSDEDRQKLVNYNEGRKILINLLGHLRIPTISMHGVEADDIIGFLSLIPYGEPKVILSDDKDLLQLITDDTSVYRPVSKQFVDKATFISKYGLNPDNYRKHFIMIRAIVGDKSDCIPGIKGIGEKTALTITRKLLKGEELGDSARAKAFREHTELFELNCKLMDIFHVFRETDLPNQIKAHLRQSDSVDQTDYNFLDTVNAYKDLEFKESMNDLRYLENSGLKRLLP